MFRKFLSIIMLACLASCSATPGPDKSISGAILGASWGAGAGAVVGHQVGAIGQGAAIGAGFGLADGLLTGIALDVAEGEDLAQQRELDALKVQVAANQRSLMQLQRILDSRSSKLRTVSSSEVVYFDKDRASLRLGSAAMLERLGERIKLNPYVGRVEIHGHTDETGDLERNMRISEARARTVANFLANQGVSVNRLKIVSHGASMPLASNDSPSTSILNRRVEIVFVQ